MKLTDIQLGDYLNIAKPHKVTGIQTSDGVLCIQTDKTDTYYSVENYEPVPLTAKIIESNGIGWDEFHQTHRANFDGERIELYSGKGVLRRENKVWSLFIETNSRKVVLDEIRYVHELQHALRLAGLGKEVTL